jgi:hypothetical protein
MKIVSVNKLGYFLSYLEFCEFAETARVTQEWISFVVVDGTTLVALEDVFAACRTHARVRWHRSRASRTLKHGRGRRLGRVRRIAVVKVGVFEHQVACDYRQREFDLDLVLTRLYVNFFRFRPQAWVHFQIDNRLVET